MKPHFFLVFFFLIIACTAPQDKPLDESPIPGAARDPTPLEGATREGRLLQACEDRLVNVTRREAVYRDVQVSLPNGTGTTQEFVRIREVNRTIVVRECTPLVENRGRYFVPEGYACTDHNGTMECDSKQDGNGDGKCDPNGGETCCRITPDERVVCKNSQNAWTETRIPVRRIA